MVGSWTDDLRITFTRPIVHPHTAFIPVSVNLIAMSHHQGMNRREGLSYKIRIQRVMMPYQPMTDVCKQLHCTITKPTDVFCREAQQRYSNSPPSTHPWQNAEDRLLGHRAGVVIANSSDRSGNTFPACLFELFFSPPSDNLCVTDARHITTFFAPEETDRK